MLTVISEQKQRLSFIDLSPLEENFHKKSVNLRDKTVDEDDHLPQRLRTLPSEELHSRFIAESVQLIVQKAVFDGTHRDNKVLEWTDPEKLKTIFDFRLRSKGETHDKLIEYISDVIKFSVKTGHPYFVNQLFSGVDPYGLIGQWLTDALNPSVYTYEVSPLLSVMEEVVLEEMRRIVGFPEGRGDGVFCPGGSISNGFGISCARFSSFPEVKEKGLHGIGRLVLFTSRDAHYSLVKLASFMGIGSNNVVFVETDSRGKMLPEKLEMEIEKAVAEGGKPFMVSATAGTTVLGAFDPLENIADICSKYKLWLHVDAAWGGGCLMSAKYKKLLQGIHRADSVTWNPHKLLGAPQQCSVFLTRHQGILQTCHSAHATYLFQKDKFYDVSFDTGDKHIQCGRRADVLKFWFMWKAKGTSGFEHHINKVFDTAHYFKTAIQSRDDFRLVLSEPECTNICFWYIPPSMRNLPYTDEQLGKVAPKIKERMMREGSAMITYQPLRDLPNFFRLVIQNSALEHEDMDRLIHIFRKLGSDLFGVAEDKRK